MNKSKIEWCDYSMNFITGCRHGCPYCYAERMVTRFAGDRRRNKLQTDKFIKTEAGLYILDEPFMDENGEMVLYPFGFEPTLHKYRFPRLGELQEGRKIFVGAMADMFGDWVPPDWIRMVMDECSKYPQHNYLFLTKNPDRYLREELPEGSHFWYGTTVTKTSELVRAEQLPPRRKRYLSIEPILERIFIEQVDLIGISWIILGAETGRRKEKVTPKAEWIEDIVLTADAMDIPVFMKDSLIPIVGEENMRREFPQELLVRQRSEKTDQKLTTDCILCHEKKERKDTVTLMVNVGRSGTRRVIGNMCRDCYEGWCGQLGIEGYAEELYTQHQPSAGRRKGSNGKKKKLQED